MTGVHAHHPRDVDPYVPERGSADYDVEHYVRLLRETYSARLARALTPADFAAVFSDPDQFSLLPPSFETMRPILTVLGGARYGAR